MLLFFLLMLLFVFVVVVGSISKLIFLGLRYAVISVELFLAGIPAF